MSIAARNRFLDQPKNNYYAKADKLFKAGKITEADHEYFIQHIVPGNWS